MRFARPLYPVDRYLAESSKKVEMVNIIEDDIWNPEPALRPEDEIILRKLHEILQSTADDLKMLSGELSKYHEPGVQVKTLPTPLDDEFNEKVHIEEVVNAKFHGHRIIDHPQHKPELLNNEKLKAIPKLPINSAKVNTGVQVNSVPTLKKPSANKKLTISRTKVIQIEEGNVGEPKENIQNNVKINNKKAPVNQSEFSYKYIETKEDTIQKNLNVQKMPSINIRSELTEQKVLHLDILPETKEEKQLSTDTSKVAVITVHHETIDSKKPLTSREPQNQLGMLISKPIQAKARKVSRMSKGDSSSTNISSDSHLHKPVKIALKPSTKSSSRIDNNKSYKITSKKSPDKRAQSNFEQWKKKINAVYGQPSTSRINNTLKTGQVKNSSRKSNIPSKTRPNLLNNKTEYIPYSQLTLGGVRVSDIEQEISDLQNKSDLPLSPILDKILSSRENSFHQNSPKKSKENDNPKILTTSDENLLQEVIDIERSITKTLSKNLKKVSKSEVKSPNISFNNNPEEVDSYADDFEDEKSEGSKNSSNDALSLNESRSLGSGVEDRIAKSQAGNDDGQDSNQKKSTPDIHNKTYTKKSNLSFKNKVDIFEFIHSVDTQDSATQSSNTHKISLKETQTSPRNERPNVQPIHNDLWPSIDPREEVGQLLKLEKDLIKKLIIDEYGDFLEKNLTKPSTSKEKDLEDAQNNVVLFQKNTQTSPAHVKSVMTSPTRTETRTTSPFTLTAVPVDRQTSPMICITNEEDIRLEIENVEEDLGISINLSSPRFSLRLPQNSREVFSNFELSNHQTWPRTERKQINETKAFEKFPGSSSSSSADAENSSSEISSLGEIKLRLKRRLRKFRVSSVSESSSTSIPSQCSSGLQTTSILPLRSEGEVSLGQITKKKLNKRESDGEMSVGRLS